MATKRRGRPVVLEEKQLMFKNFSGVEGRYNREGDRNFNVVLNPDEAEAMAADGWNVKTLQPREEGDAPLYILPVAVRYNKYPPKIVMITKKGKTELTEDTVGLLDTARIEKADMILNPSTWDDDGELRIKAYLRSLYVTLELDPLEEKYFDAPMSAVEGMCTPGVDCPEDL